MRFVLVLTLVTSCQISMAQSLCNRSSVRLETNPTSKTLPKSAAENSTLLTTSEVKIRGISFDVEGSYSIMNGTNRSNNLTNRRDDYYITDENQYEDLRLEYYKYRILSHLSITEDPDSFSFKQINPDLRHKLARNEINENDGRGTKGRKRRSVSCSEIKGEKPPCCLETFYVNFTEIGWDKWIIYPPGYNANYCRGQCDLSNARYYHSTLLSKFSNMIGLCCSPKQMAPLQLLYIDTDNKVHQKSLPDMVVESCDCA